MSEDLKEYQRGYRAGRKRTEKEEAEHRARFTAELMEHRSRRDAFACAALTGLIIRNQWGLDVKNDDHIEWYVRSALNFGQKAASKP